MNTLLTAAALFSLLIAHARSPSGIDNDRRISNIEIQNALVALELDTEGVSRQETNLVREVLFDSRRLLTPEAQLTADSWLVRNAGAPSGRARPLRRVDAFRGIVSWLELTRGRGAITAYDAGLLLSILDSSSQVRVLEIQQWVGTYPLSAGAKEVFARWLQRNKVLPLPSDTAAALTPAIQGLLWMSESDRPLRLISFGKLPAWPLTKTQMRQLLGESTAVSIDQPTVKQLFAWVEPALASSDANERLRAQQFKNLRTVLEQQLTLLRAFKVGEIDRDLIIVGKAKDGTVCGIVTQVIES